ncbi:hypothetical protein ADN00_05020 [Ornatilinea apprima]|uniref:Uncharacterized protein n=1 Tax=Ornatilinea apprima TaxID=1134406 RepID=A0A0P6YBA3_9CHLR|nr:hypothetical protein [Ornatilinea apprima]KPL79207.1 hypothetical protein ADN00_05020 [Ornatilinea apprima]
MRKWIIIAALGAAILFAALLLLDFHLSISSTAQNISVSRISGGAGDAQNPNPLPPQTSPLRLYTPDPKLSQLLARQIKEAPGIDQIEIVSELPEHTGQAVLVVTLPEHNRLWLGFFATAETNAQMTFASDGQWQSNHIEMRDGQPPVVRVEACLALRDRSAGLMSRPWYLRHLREQIAEEVVKTLSEQLASQ